MCTTLPIYHALWIPRTPLHVYSVPCTSQSVCWGNNSFVDCDSPRRYRHLYICLLSRWCAAGTCRYAYGNKTMLWEDQRFPAVHPFLRKHMFSRIVPCPNSIHETATNDKCDLSRFPVNIHLCCSSTQVTMWNIRKHPSGDLHVMLD